MDLSEEDCLFVVFSESVTVAEDEEMEEVVDVVVSVGSVVTEQLF